MPNFPELVLRTTCRVCGAGDLAPIISLGELYVSNFIDNETAHLAERAPLELVLCDTANGGCGLLQLRHTVSHESMYRNYWYRSGTNATMTGELRGIARRAEEIAGLTSGHHVIDIGANDGTLLRSYGTEGIHRVGFEPARNLGKWNKEGTTKIIRDFFAYKPWKEAFGGAKAKVITAIAMFYDLEDPNKFVGDVVKCLDENGVFIIQMSYLPLMLEKNAFDNICHEHVKYYSLASLENLLHRHGLEVFDVELNDVNGGSFRVYMRHKGKGKKLNVPKGAAERVSNLRKTESDLKLHDLKIYEQFAKRVLDIKARLRKLIEDETARGKKVYVYGASTKGNTLLQYFGLDSRLIPAAAERNPDKWGKRTVGTNIPIISEEQARAEKPDYFLVLPWHFLDEFVERESEYLRGGGKFIVPLPEFRIIEVN